MFLENMGVQTGHGTNLVASHDSMGRHGRKMRQKFFERDLIFTRRDPRDVLVSNWHLVTKRHKLTNMSLDRFVQQRRWGVNRMVRWYELWANRIRHWRRLRRVHIWTYEEAWDDPVKEFTKLARYLHLDAPAARIQEAVKLSSFERMQDMERARGGLLFSDSRAPADLEDHSTYFVRRGGVGGWREELSMKAQEYINSRLKSLPPFMRRYRDGQT
jgi:hypothetical protein